MFSLIQLKAFIAVAEELHFGAAAHRLSMTQPPLSRQIQLLEKDLQVKLFERTSRSVVLTAAGLTLLPGARQILDLAAKSRVDVRRAAAGKSGSLTVGYTAMAGQSALPLVLRRFAAEYPDVSLVLRELVSTDQMDGLARGSLDIGLLRPTVARPGVQSRPLMEDRLVAALPNASTLLAGTEEVSIADLGKEPLLMYSSKEARYFHELVLRLYAHEGIQPNVTQYASQIPALLAFVAAGLGVALVPASAQDFAPAGISFREIAGPPETRALGVARLDIAWNSNNSNPAVLRLLDLLPGTES
ncbi:LysR substrate-binding domain-containing protein [Arthrobacter sp.]|uniref:LysR family transcriptional regulator n=1 Tax=Arthrobacter sp. TaxID=1667 RepID=UPI003399F071